MRYRLTVGDVIHLSRKSPDDPWTHIEIDGYQVSRDEAKFVGDDVEAPIPVFGSVYYPPDGCDDPIHREDADNWSYEQIGTKVVRRHKSAVKLLNLIVAKGTEVWEASGSAAIRVA